jgi:hypothetical protein
MISRKQQALWGHFALNRLRTLGIIVRRLIDPRTDRVRSHQPRIVGSQHLGHRSDIRKARIKPQIVIVWIEDNRHSVVDGSGYGVRRCGQNRATADPVAARVFPALP